MPRGLSGRTYGAVRCDGFDYRLVVEYFDQHVLHVGISFPPRGMRVVISENVPVPVLPIIQNRSFPAMSAFFYMR